MEPVEKCSLLEELFESSAEVFGKDFKAYRNHAYRVLNFALALGPSSPDCSRKLEIACYFHDIGIWADSTVDYLQPSVARARAYLDSQGLSHWNDEVARMITEHHKITTADKYGPLVEAFRRADWTDVSLGLRRFGLPRTFVSQVKRAFPNSGFHRRLVELTLGRFRQHPLSPLPMFKW